jgi:hypothetical protein
MYLGRLASAKKAMIMAKYTLYAHIRPNGEFRIFSDITTQKKADDHISWYCGSVEKAARAGHRMVVCEVDLPDSGDSMDDSRGG